MISFSARTCGVSALPLGENVEAEFSDDGSNVTLTCTKGKK